MCSIESQVVIFQSNKEAGKVVRLFPLLLFHIFQLMKYGTTKALFVFQLYRKDLVLGSSIDFLHLPVYKGEPLGKTMRLVIQV